MWLYEKKLQYPVNIKKSDARAAGVIISQLGGPDGEMGAALRYLSQRYTMPWPEIQALLTDIGTEELAHVEIISAILYQLTEGLTMKDIKTTGFDKYFVDHTVGIYPQAASGVPFSAGAIQSKGDPIADLTEDMAAEQKARVTYDNILQLVDDEDVKKPIRFLREREIVHYQRFAEALEIVKSKLDKQNYYKTNPEFNDKPKDYGKKHKPMMQGLKQKPCGSTIQHRDPVFPGLANMFNNQNSQNKPIPMFDEQGFNDFKDAMH